MRDLHREIDTQLPALPLYRGSMLELYRSDRIVPPFAENGDQPSPLLGGLQAWEDWVLPAIRPAEG